MLKPPKSGKHMRLVKIEFQKVYRQDDDQQFLHILENVRMNKVTPENIMRLNQRVTQPLPMYSSRQHSWRIGEVVSVASWMPVEKPTFPNLNTTRTHLLYGSHSKETPYNHTPPTTPTISKREDAKLKRLKTLLTAIGENGVNLKVLMEAMQRKDRKGFVSTYITPNIESGYIATLYPETPNHPIQSYYLTNKGREALNNL